jgi:predicted AAA+ superfamily ATPase
VKFLGKVEVVDMHPMDFKEFLRANDSADPGAELTAV